MSWRQPARKSIAVAASSAKRNCAGRLMRHLRYFQGIEAFEKTARLVRPEFRVLRLDAEEEMIAAGAFEIRHIENRMIGLRQSIQGEHAEDRGQRSAQDRA